jgi:sec-independent protein translocase protein TatA
MMTFAYFSPQDWAIVAIIALVLFGGSKIPQLAKGFGEGIREFKKAVNTDSKGDDKAEEKAE